MKIDNYTIWRNNTLNAKLQTNKKYLILKMGSYLISTAGLGWYLIYTLNGIRFAIENGYIPVVDWQNCKIPQYDTKKVGKENVWEYFFEQPFEIGIETAYESEDYWVIDDVRELLYQYPLNVVRMVNFYDQDVLIWREYFQKYIRLKKEIEKCFNDTIDKQIDLNKNIIGVLARGTDYTALKPVGHLSPISLNEIFAEINQELRKKKDCMVFLATEDEYILKKFEKEYPGRVYSIDSKRYDDLGHNTLNVIYKGENGYERDLKYLYSLYVISKSPVFICAACGGGAIASLMRKSFGDCYRFLCNGHNKAKGIVVGSITEKNCNQIVFLGNKPILFYVLNSLKLLQIEDVDIIVSEKIKFEYQELISDGGAFGLKINYIVSDTYDVVEYMVNNPEFMIASRVVLFYADYFCHGRNVMRELIEKVNMFDGSFAWGAKTSFMADIESIELDENNHIPIRAYLQHDYGNYSLMGKYVFDYELTEILQKLSKENKKITIVDILNEYIDRKKLFFVEYARGIIYSKVNNIDELDKLGHMICLMEELQGQKIGDFESFKIAR